MPYTIGPVLCVCLWDVSQSHTHIYFISSSNLSKDLAQLRQRPVCTARGSLAKPWGSGLHTYTSVLQAIAQTAVQNSHSRSRSDLDRPCQKRKRTRLRNRGVPSASGNGGRFQAPLYTLSQDEKATNSPPLFISLTQSLSPSQQQPPAATYFCTEWFSLAQLTF